MRKVLTILTAIALVVGCAQNDQFYSNVLRTQVWNQVYDNQQYDFLWVLDNSGSMKDRTAYVRDNINTFLTTLANKKAIDYQMAVTTVDFFTQQGKLVQTPGGLSVVKSATSSDPMGDFAAIVNSVTDSPTSFWEQGLESAYQAVYQHGAQFSRPGVPLIIIFVTDADDYSCASNCFGIEPEHNANWIPFTMDRYAEYFSTVKAAENSQVLIYPIVAQKTSGCGPEDTGTRYIDLMQQVGTTAFTGGICPNEIASSYQGVAQAIANRSTNFQLNSPASGKGIEVYVNGVLIPNSPDNYIYDAPSNSIIFTGYAPTKGATIQVSYDQTN